MYSVLYQASMYTVMLGHTFSRSYRYFTVDCILTNTGQNPLIYDMPHLVYSNVISKHSPLSLPISNSCDHVYAKSHTCDLLQKSVIVCL